MQTIETSDAIGTAENARSAAKQAFATASREFSRNPSACNYRALETAALALQDATYEVSLARRATR